MELELGLAPPNHESEYSYMNHDHDDDEVESKDSSLLLWSGSGDHPKSRTIQKYEMNENGEEDEDMEGWPPINSWRKEVLHRHDEGGWAAAPARNSMFVKVKMAGVPIGRKIDLARFDSYQALTHTLINMFVKYTKNEMREGDYTILYQDNEGDWLLAGDVPWEIFVESVHRMEIQRNAN